MDDNGKKLRIFYQNVRGLRTKTNDFYRNLLLLDYDLVVITETWLCDGILDAELCGNKYNVIRRDRGSLGGGIMLLFSPQLQVRVRSEWERQDLQCLWVTVSARCLGSSRDLHAIVNIPPNSQVSSRIQIFLEFMSMVGNLSRGAHFIIVGDFNLPCISWVSGESKVLKKGLVEVQSMASDLIALFSFLDLSQYNMVPNKYNNILDLFLSDFPLSMQSVYASRHLP